MHKVALAALAVACLAESGMAANCRANKVGQRVTLSPKNIKTIVDRHNAARDDVIAHGGQDVLYMQWNNELQLLAETLAGSCVFQHSSSECRSHTTLSSYVGENLAARSNGDLDQDLDKMVQSWIDEKKDYNPANGQCSGVCGHYTQVIWPNSQYVGCAVTKCQSGILSMPSTDMRCVYAAGGNYNGQLAVHPATGACRTKDKCGGPHEGSCIITGSSYKCACHPGYTNQGGNPENKCVSGGSPPAPPPPSNGPIKCDPATTCNGRGKCTNDKCKCDPGWNGASCSLKDDKCAGYCKHAPKCTVANNVPKCPTCDAGWEGERCDQPAGGAYTPKGMWKDVEKEVTLRRQNYGRAPIPMRSGDRNAAIKEANTCNTAYHPDSEVNSEGYHTWGMMICVDQPEDKFPYGGWLGKDVIGKMAKFATSKWTRAYGCALSANSCGPKSGYCNNKRFRMLICEYELQVGHSIP